MLIRLRAAVLALVGLLFVAGWPGAALRAVAIPLAAPAIPADVTGRDGALDVVVREPGEGGAPIAGARVRAFAILDGRAHAAGVAESDEDGRATLESLPEAEHWIVAEAAGRARASRMVVIVSGARRLDLELGPEHLLDVEVADEAGRPIAGAELEVRGADPFPVGARTGADGRARVGRLGGGLFTVAVRAAGYEDVTRRRVPEGEPLRVVLGKRGALVVEVVGEDGRPAPGSRVLVGALALGATRVTETRADGTVRVAGLEPGSYALRATNGARVSPIELGVVINKGEEHAVRLTLSPGIMVRAHVVSALDDDDVRGARVTLAEGGLSPFPLDGVTDRRGRVVLGPIARGPATLSARAEGFVPKPAVQIDGEAEVKLALLRGGALVGKITDARGHAVDGATIRVVGTDLDGMPIDEDPSRWSFREAHFTAQLRGPSPLLAAGELGVVPGPVPPIPQGPSSFALAPGSALGERGGVPAEPWVSGRDGSFEALPVTPGRVRALVSHPEYVEAISEPVLLEPDKEAKVTVVLLRGGALEGRVLDARGHPVSGAHVTALATRGTLERMTRTGSDGAFAFAALPDAVTLLVAREADPGVALARVEVAVPEAGRETVKVTLPDPRPPLPVRVTDHRGQPIEAAQISAVSLDPGEALRATAFSDAGGRAELAGARGIATRVEVHAPRYASRVVVSEAKASELTVALAPAEAVRGEVVTRRRDPIASAEVALYTEAGVRHARTNAAGEFTFSDVSAGPAEVRVRAEGYAPEERAVTIEARRGERPTELARFELAEEGLVEGVVVDEEGKPVAGARVAEGTMPTYLPASGTPSGMVVTDARGRFRLGGLPEGEVALEAYAADVGHAREDGVRVSRGRTTRDVRLVLYRDGAGAKEPAATGGVAVTLGDTAGGGEPPVVVVVAVSEGSEAERAGLAAGDVLLEVSGVKVTTIAEARARLAGPVHDDVLVKVRRGGRVVPLRIAREEVRR